MYDYRIYLLNEQGRVDDVPHVIRCATDEDATKQARQLRRRQTIELWQGDRLVIKIDPPRS